MLWKCLKLKADERVEYIVGSVHHLKSMALDVTADGMAKVEAEFGGHVAMQKAYFVKQREMVEKLGPTIVAHFDLVRKYRGTGYVYCEEVMVEIRKTLAVVKEHGCLLDINCALKRKGDGRYLSFG